MLIRKAFKYRLKTTPEIDSALSRMAGCRRFVWNNGLATIKTALNSCAKRPSYCQLANVLPAMKKEKPFLAEDAIAQSLQQTLKDLDKAIRDAFDKKQPLKEFPVFKKKGKSVDSFRVPGDFKVDQGNSRIRIPKLGWLRYRNSREMTGIPKNITISRNGRYWYASIQTEQEVAEPVHPSDNSLGIDRGVNVMAACSDGTLILPLNALKQASRKLARLQKQLSKKIKFSENWKKHKAKIAKLHSRIADMRRDYLHKASTAIAKSHGLVVLEDLKVKNMSASAKGTKEAPGRNVRQKAGLNKAILDQGWGEFARQLEYKLNWLGGTYLEIPPAYTSQKCSRCGHIHPDNRKGIRFKCTSCGYEAHADINAACNILAAGLAVIACGEYPDVKGSAKQEPPKEEYALAA